jgi:hypothetical protein
MYEHLHIVLLKQAIAEITWATLPNTTFDFKHYEKLLETWMGLKHLLNR